MPRPPVPRSDLPRAARDILAAMRAAKRVLISSSANLDADGLGSELALAAICDFLKIPCVVVNDGPVPASLQFLPGLERAKAFPDGAQAECELLLTVDCGSRAMLGRVGEHLPPDLRIGNIDHHVGNTLFGTWNWVDHDAGAAGQLVYELAALAGMPITQPMATCLYAAITTDTGGFAYSNTSARSHSIASHLIVAGADPSAISRALHRSRSGGFLKLMGRVLESLHLCGDGRIAVAHVTRAMCEATGGDPDEGPGLMELVKSVGTAEVAMLLKEKADGIVKVSLRSEGGVDVNTVAQQFGGGGHARASGCRIQAPIADVEARLVAAVEPLLPL